MAETQTHAAASRPAANPFPHEDPGLVELFSRTRAESGRTLLELLDQQPMLLVFLRHFGCAFARETLADIASARPALEARRVRPVFVHMATPDRAQRFFRRYGLQDAEHVSDPTLHIYQAPIFHLLKHTVIPEYFALDQIPKFFTRGLKHGVGGAAKGETAAQLPGVFFIQDRHITKAFRHKKWADRPDYPLFGV